MIWSHNVKITGNDQPRQHCCKEHRCYEYLEEKGHWINELINYKAVYRTAPATPGLLTIDFSAVPGGADEPQGQVVQGVGQLPSDRGVGQGRAAGKHGQAPACWLPDMLVVAA